MKKLITIALAAALSAAMITCMAACSNNTDQQSSGSSAAPASNPFGWDMNSSAQSETTAASQPGGETTPSEVTAPSVPDYSSTVSFSTISETSTISTPIEPPVSGTSDLPLRSDISDFDDSDRDDSDFDDSDFDDSDISYEISKITPKGTVMPEYVGTWVWQVDFSSLSPEEASFARELYDPSTTDLRFILDASGTASMTASMYGETSSYSDGQWSAEGNTIYITFYNDTAAFTVNNGKMTSEYFAFGYFRKN